MLNNLNNKEISKILFKGCCGIGLIGMLMSVGGMLLLLVIDKEHAWFKGIFSWILKTENHFSGDVWFAVIATLIGAAISGFIGAIPSSLCGLLALYQTRKLHDLESRYHRPMLELYEMETRFILLRKDLDFRALNDLSDEQKTNIRKMKRDLVPWYIMWDIMFTLKNEVTIKHMWIDKIELRAAGKEYCIEFNQNDKFSSNFKKKKVDNELVYSYSCELSELGRMPKEDFWNVIEEFGAYNEREDYIYKHLEQIVHLNILYEYGEDEASKNILHVDWDVKNSKWKDNHVINMAYTGYFKYI